MCLMNITTLVYQCADGEYWIDKLVSVLMKTIETGKTILIKVKSSQNFVKKKKKKDGPFKR